MPVISVIVPVYNVEKYLRRCVDSILNQTFKDFELILVDDGSTDKSGEICDSYINKDNRIQVIHQKNQGQAKARNRGVELARGEWIHFVDGDDLIHSRMLEILYFVSKKCKVNLCMCGAVESEKLPEDFENIGTFNFESYDVNELYLKELYEKGEHRYWVVWGKLIKKEIVEKIPFKEGRIYEDNAVTCRWLYEAQTIADISLGLYYYMINPNGTTKSKFNLKKLDYLWALEEQIGFYKEINYISMRELVCREYVIAASNLYVRIRDEEENEEEAKRLKKRIRKWYRDNKGYFKLTKIQRIHVMEKLYPKKMQLYWIIKHAFNVLSQEGVCVFGKKIMRKLKGNK